MPSPHVELGNSLLDAGQGANTFASGLVSQNSRMQQLAMQKALADANVAHLGAETNVGIPAQAAEATARTGEYNAQTTDINAQETQRQAGNAPADQGDEDRLRAIMPEAHPGIMRGLTKAQAAAYIDVAGKARMAGLRINLQGAGLTNNEEGQLRGSYDRESKLARVGIDNYRETLNAFKMARDTDNPIAGEGMLLSWLKQRTNRMNQTEINRVAQLGGPENMVHRFMSHVQGGVPMDSAMLKSFLNASTPGGSAHYNDYQALRHSYTSTALKKGLDPNNVVMDDDYGADIPQLEQAISAGKQVPTNSNPIGPTGNQSINPRFDPRAQQTPPVSQ